MLLNNLSSDQQSYCQPIITNHMASPLPRISKKRFSTIDESLLPQNPENITKGIKQIENLIPHSKPLWVQNQCKCNVCSQKKVNRNQLRPQKRNFELLSANSHEWLLQLLNGLTLKCNKTLKLFVPDVLFLTRDGLEIFLTNKRDFRITKTAGTTPLKSIYSTLLRLRKDYKGMLSQNFKKKVIDSVNPKLMHAKYYQKLLPTHFHDADDCQTLNRNKQTVKKYILHNNDKYILNEIEEHKTNENELICTIRYSDGNTQLLTQKEFEMITLTNKIPEDAVFVQSFIKTKEADSIVYSEYVEGDQSIDLQIMKETEIEIMVLLGGLSKYDEGYDDLENFEDRTSEMMKNDPQKYVDQMTYKIIHFLAMAAQLYISHLKIKWLINDIGNVYLQDIIQFDTVDNPQRTIRYRLPPSEDIKEFYTDPKFFVNVFKSVKVAKEEEQKRAREKISVEKQHSKKIENESLASYFQGEVEKGKVRTMSGLKMKFYQQRKSHQSALKKSTISYSDCHSEVFEPFSARYSKNIRNTIDTSISMTQRKSVGGADFPLAHNKSFKSNLMSDQNSWKSSLKSFKVGAEGGKQEIVTRYQRRIFNEEEKNRKYEKLQYISSVAKRYVELKKNTESTAKLHKSNSNSKLGKKPNRADWQAMFQRSQDNEQEFYQ